MLACMLDDHINESEQSYITTTAAAFGYDDSVVTDFISWMKEGMAWEKRGTDLWGRMG